MIASENDLQVTGVGLNTEWGLLMASISEDNNEETPLQVSPLFPLFSVVTSNSNLFLALLAIYEYGKIGTPKWSGNFHWQSWAYCGWVCSSSSSGQVSWRLIVVFLSGMQLHVHCTSC